MRSYPPGLDVIIYNATTLIDLNKFLEKNDPLREHVGSIPAEPKI